MAFANVKGPKDVQDKSVLIEMKDRRLIWLKIQRPVTQLTTHREWIKCDLFYHASIKTQKVSEHF